MSPAVCTRKPVTPPTMMPATMAISDFIEGLSRLVEAEIRQVAVLHHIGLGFQALLVGALRLCLAPSGNHVGKADDLSSDETFLDVGVDGARSLYRGHTGFDQPLPVLDSA